MRVDVIRWVLVVLGVALLCMITIGHSKRSESTWLEDVTNGSVPLPVDEATPAPPETPAPPLPGGGEVISTETGAPDAAGKGAQQRPPIWKPAVARPQMQPIDPAHWSLDVSDSQQSWPFKGPYTSRAVSWCEKDQQYLPGHFVAYDPDDENATDYRPLINRSELVALFPGHQRFPVMGAVTFPSVAAAKYDWPEVGTVVDRAILDDVTKPSVFDFAAKRATTEPLFRLPKHVSGRCKKINAAFSMAIGGSEWESDRIGPLLNTWREHATPCDYLVFVMTNGQLMTKIRARESGRHSEFIETVLPRHSSQQQQQQQEPQPTTSKNQSSGPTQQKQQQAVAWTWAKGPVIFLTAEDWLDKRTILPLAELRRVDVLRFFLQTMVGTFRFVMNLDSRDVMACGAPFEPLEKLGRRLRKPKKPPPPSSRFEAEEGLTPFLSGTSEVMNIHEHWVNPHWINQATNSLTFVDKLRQMTLRAASVDVPEKDAATGMERVVRKSVDRGIWPIINSGQYHGTATAVLDYATAFDQNVYRFYEIHYGWNASVRNVSADVRNKVYDTGFDQGAHNHLLTYGLRAADYPHLVIMFDVRTSAYRNNYHPFTEREARFDLMNLPLSCPGAEQPAYDMLVSPTAEQKARRSQPRPPRWKKTGMHQGRVLSILHQGDRHLSAMRSMWQLYHFKDLPNGQSGPDPKPCAVSTAEGAAAVSQARSSGGLVECGECETIGGDGAVRKVPDSLQHMRLGGGPEEEPVMPNDVRMSSDAVQDARLPPTPSSNFECTAHHVFFVGFNLAGNPYRGEDAACVQQQSSSTPAPASSSTVAPDATAAAAADCVREARWDVTAYETLQRVVVTFQRQHTSCEMLVVFMSSIDSERVAAISYDTTWNNVRFVELPSQVGFSQRAVAAAAASWLEAAKRTWDLTNKRVVIGAAFEDALQSEPFITSNLFAPMFVFESSLAASNQSAAEKRQLTAVALRANGNSSKTAAVFFSCKPGPSAVGFKLAVGLLRGMAAAKRGTTGPRVPSRPLAVLASIKGGDNDSVETKLAPYRNYIRASSSSSSSSGTDETPDPTRTWIRDGSGFPWSCAETPIALALNYPTAKAAWPLSPFYRSRRPFQIMSNITNYTQWRKVGVIECGNGLDGRGLDWCFEVHDDWR